MDINNTKLEGSRPPTDLTNQFKANYSYALPIGGAHMLGLRGGWDRLLQGWSTSGILSWVSGNPISIDTQSLTAAGWGTFLREDFSAENMADTTLTKGQIDGLLGVRRTGDGVYYIAPSAIGPGGYGVAQAGAAPFSDRRSPIPAQERWANYSAACSTDRRYFRWTRRF